MTMTLLFFLVEAVVIRYDIVHLSQCETQPDAYFICNCIKRSYFIDFSEAVNNTIKQNMSQDFFYRKICIQYKNISVVSN